MQNRDRAADVNRLRRPDIYFGRQRVDAQAGFVDQLLKRPLIIGHAFIGGKRFPPSLKEAVNGFRPLHEHDAAVETTLPAGLRTRTRMNFRRPPGVIRKRDVGAIKNRKPVNEICGDVGIRVEIEKPVSL